MREKLFFPVARSFTGNSKANPRQGGAHAKSDNNKISFFVHFSAPSTCRKQFSRFPRSIFIMIFVGLRAHNIDIRRKQLNYSKSASREKSNVVKSEREKWKKLLTFRCSSRFNINLPKDKSFRFYFFRESKKKSSQQQSEHPLTPPKHEHEKATKEKM